MNTPIRYSIDNNKLDQTLIDLQNFKLIQIKHLKFYNLIIISIVYESLKRGGISRT